MICSLCVGFRGVLLLEVVVLVDDALDVAGVNVCSVAQDAYGQGSYEVWVVQSKVVQLVQVVGWVTTLVVDYERCSSYWLGVDALHDFFVLHIYLTLIGCAYCVTRKLFP